MPLSTAVLHSTFVNPLLLLRSKRYRSKRVRPNLGRRELLTSGILACPVIATRKNPYSFLFSVKKKGYSET